MNKFESILFDYGRYVFVSVFRKAQEEERYEDCAGDARYYAKISYTL